MSVPNTYLMRDAGYYSTVDGSGPYAVDSSGNAYLLSGAGTSTSTPSAVTPIPVATAAAGIVTVKTTVAASSVVVKASAGNLYGLGATAGASAGYVMLYNLAAAPADGTVTPVRSWAIAANTTLEIGFTTPLQMSVGIVLAFSTTGPFTQTLSATAFLAGEAV